MAKQQAAPQKPAASKTPTPGKAMATTGADDKALIVVLPEGQVPDYLPQDAQGRGNEGVTTDDLVIPRLELIQALSHSVTPGDAGFVEGAKAGQLMNSVTKQLYGDSVIVVPVVFKKLFLVWRDLKKGGGFLGAYPDMIAAQDVANAKGGEAEGFEVIDTPTHFCLIVDVNTGRVEEITIPMPRTKAKTSRQWNSMVRMAGGDRFSRAYRIGTALEKNMQNQAYHNFTVGQMGFPNKSVFQQAEKVYSTFGASNRVMDTSGLDVGASGGREDDGNDM